MPQTFSGGLQPFCSPSDFLLMADARLVGDLVRDDGTQATPTELLTDPSLALGLQMGAGFMETALLVADRYQIADLLALPANSNAAAMLKWINGGLALQFLRFRRGFKENEYQWYMDARKFLAMLEQGVNILPFVQSQQAGLPITQRVLPTSHYFYTPTQLTLNDRYWPRPRNGWGGGNGCF